jgi:hypothetical protein
MKHCFVSLLTAMFVGVIANAQLVNNGATITVQSGATIKCTGTIINNSGGTIANAGTVSSDGELRNETGGTLNGAGIYEATTKFINNGVALSGINLKLIGSSNTDSIKSGAGSSYINVNLAKGVGNTATLSDAMTITGALTFDNDDNRLILEDENLIMGPAATIVSADANEFVQTNYTGVTPNVGVVTKQSLASTTFTYEVGFGVGQYNPVSISNTGTSDNISVRCMQNVLDQGLTGSAVTADFANNSWVVTEAVAGGSNLQLIGGWAASDELPSFNRNKVGIARYNTGTDWDLPASNVVAASGSGPYTRNRNNITSTGVFAIADLDRVNAARLNIKIMLNGPFNSGTGTMNDGLRTIGLIPTTQPYSSAMGAIFTRLGVYDGTPSVNESIPSLAVLDVAGTNDDIVDWVYISMQDGTTPATKLQTRAALVQRDGDIVEFDATSATYVPVRMPLDADGNYYLVIAHRNHLPIRTALSQSLQDNVIFNYNFTTAQSQAYQDPAIGSLAPPNNNAAMRALPGGVFGMWGGNVNSNSNVRFGGLNNDLAALVAALGGNQGAVLSIYSPADINMDGLVRFGGLNNDLAALVAVLSGNQSAVYSQHQ